MFWLVQRAVGSTPTGTVSFVKLVLLPLDVLERSVLLAKLANRTFHISLSCCCRCTVAMSVFTAVSTKLRSNITCCFRVRWVVIIVLVLITAFSDYWGSFFYSWFTSAASVRCTTLVVVVVELPRLLYTVVGQKPANPPRESDDISGIRLDTCKFPVGQERLPKGFPSLLTPRRTFPQEMLSALSTSPSFRMSAQLLWCAE